MAELDGDLLVRLSFPTGGLRRVLQEKSESLCLVIGHLSGLEAPKLGDFVSEVSSNVTADVSTRHGETQHSDLPGFLPIALSDQEQSGICSKERHAPVEHKNFLGSHVHFPFAQMEENEE